MRPANISISTPNGRYNVFWNGVDLQLRISGVANAASRLWRSRAKRTAAPQGVLQRWDVADERLERIEHRSFARDRSSALALHRQCRVGKSSTIGLGGELAQRGAALRRMNRPGTRIGSRGLGATIGLGFQIIERVDDAAPDLPIRRACAVGAVLFKRAAGEAEESGRFGRAQKARRQTGQRVGHDRTSVILQRPPGLGGESSTTMAE